MSAQSINFAEKRLLNHLQLGGSVTDDVGRQLVMRFAQKAWSDSQIRAICERQGFDLEDICVIYAAMIQSLMPNPCIAAGGLLLVPTLFFMEPFRLEAMLSQLHRDLQGRVGTERRAFIIEIASEAARQCWEAHSAARGEARFEIVNVGGRASAGGCLGVLVMGVLSFFALSAGAAVLWETLLRDSK